MRMMFAATSNCRRMVTCAAYCGADPDSEQRPRENHQRHTGYQQHRSGHAGGDGHHSAQARAVAACVNYRCGGTHGTENSAE